jgi:capsular exopolysaccharide synthesis family protein
MDIQKVEDAHRDPYAQQEMAVYGHGGHGGGGAMQVMAVPDVGAPRANPLTMIWRRKGLLLLVTVACVLGAGVRYLVSTAVFRSEAKLAVHTQPGSRAALDLAGGGNGGGGGGPTGNHPLQTQCELIRSTSILAEVLAQPEVMESRTLRSADSRVGYMKENLLATVGEGNDIITVSFDSPFPDEARSILAAVVDAYKGYHTKEQRARLFELEQWRDKAQSTLDTKQRELLEFRKANGALTFAGEKGSLAMQRLEGAQKAVADAQAAAADAKGALDAAQSMLAAPEKLRQFVDSLRAQGLSGADPGEAALRGQLLAMEQQRQSLEGRFLAGHPSIRAADAAIASLKARIAELDRAVADAHLATLSQRLAGARAREAELRRAYDEQHRAATELAAKAAELGHYEAEVNRLAGVVEQADLKIMGLKAAPNAGGAPTVQVFDPPRDGRVVRPVRDVMLLQGLAIGLALGCLAALVRDWTDQGLRSTEEVTRTLGLSLLGSVPHIPGPPNPMASGRKVDLEPAGDTAETYRTIRTAVFFGTPDRESRTILVTSPSPGDGRSTFASNLAIVMAQTGRRVLLLDCDFRRPVQHRIFECRPGVGLSSVLAGHESLDRAIQGTGIAGLDLLPAGPLPGNPSEILNSQSFNEVLEELSVRYEHVVVDSPPVMAVADSQVLAAMCSVTILVLRAGSSTRKASLHARRALQSVGAAILGVVVNDVRRARDRHGEAGGYGGSYRAKYDHGSAQEATGGAGGRATSIVPARSFLDLRRK